MTLKIVAQNLDETQLQLALVAMPQKKRERFLGNGNGILGPVGK